MPGWHAKTKQLVKDGKLPMAGSLIGLNTTIVPHTSKPASAVRVFLDAIPDKERQVKWNDEAGVSTVHITPRKDGPLTRRL